MDTNNKDQFELLKIKACDAEQSFWKHPLQNKWTLWYLHNDKTKAWTSLQKPICTVGTAEDFWTLQHFLVNPSQLSKGCDYSLFKEGILPMWEDPANINGGRWIFLLNGENKSILDETWLNLCLVIIGDAFQYSDDVCGVVVNVRYKYNKISIWTTDVRNTEAVGEIGFKLRDLFRLTGGCLQYQVHRVSMYKENSRIRPMYVI